MKITTPKQAVELLLEAGWVQKSRKQKSSHFQYVHPDSTMKVTVPMSQRSLKRNISHNVCKALGLKGVSAS